MKLFLCPSCGQVVYFESVRCMGCGARLGFVPELRTMATVEPAASEADNALTRDTVFHSCASASDAAPGDLRLCATYLEHATCNWTVGVDDPEPFCRSCRLNEVIPSLDTPEAQTAWTRLERAKRRLLYTLLALNDFNRGTGLPDLYPFALSAPAVEKIAFVHRIIHERPAVSEAIQSPAVAISA